MVLFMFSGERYATRNTVSNDSSAYVEDRS